MEFVRININEEIDDSYAVLEFTIQSAGYAA